MRIRQRDDRYRNKKKKKQQHGSSHHNQAKQVNVEPAYRRKPNPIRRYDTDVLSPVSMSGLLFLSSAEPFSFFCKNPDVL